MDIRNVIESYLLLREAERTGEPPAITLDIGNDDDPEVLPEVSEAEVEAVLEQQNLAPRESIEFDDADFVDALDTRAALFPNIEECVEPLTRSNIPWTRDMEWKRGNL